MGWCEFDFLLLGLRDPEKLEIHGADKEAVCFQQPEWPFTEGLSAYTMMKNLK